MATRKSSRKASSKKRGDDVGDDNSRSRGRRADGGNVVTTAGAPAFTADGGDYIVLNGQKLELEHHPTDFSVMGTSEALAEAARGEAVDAMPLAANVMRVRAANEMSRDALMGDVRKETVAHHIYQVKGTREEIVIDDRIILKLRNEDPEELERIIDEFKLVPESRMGNAHVLRVTEASSRNPLKVANEIARRETVESCVPDVLVPLQMHQQPSFISTHPLAGSGTLL